MTKLKKLYLDHNQLTKLPHDLHKLGHSLTLLGISSWGGLLLRRRIGLCYGFWSWVLAMVTLMLFTPVAHSAGAWAMLSIWWLAVFFAGLAHVLVALLRLYNVHRGTDHVHRWSPGEPRRPVGWLVTILPGFMANNRHVQNLQEPIVLILIGAVVWGIDVLVFRDTSRPAESATAVFVLPVFAASATLLHMFILYSRAMMAKQVQRDSLVEQEASAESFQEISDEFNERGPEGLVSFGR